MKSLRKYAMLAVLLGGALGVQAQNATPPKQLPGSEMKTQGDDQAKVVKDDKRHVLHLQALARKDKDVIKLTCINDKLVQINAQENLFDGNRTSLEGALEGSDSETAAARELYFGDMTKASGDIHKLRGEADGCAGELEMYKQESKSDFTRPDLDDPTDGRPFENAEQMGDPDVDVPAFPTPWK